MLWLLIPAVLAAIYVMGVVVVAIKYRKHPQRDVLWMVAVGWPYWVWLWIRAPRGVSPLREGLAKLQELAALRDAERDRLRELNSPVSCYREKEKP